MSSHFGDWLFKRGLAGDALMVVRVVRTTRALEVELRGQASPATRQQLGQLAQELTQRWDIPVQFALEEDIERVDVRSQIRAVVGSTQPALAALLSDDCLEWTPAGLMVRFANPITKSLFDKWGGTPRLRREVKELQDSPIDEHIDESAPPVPDQPVAVALRARNGAEDEVIGRRVDISHRVALDQLPNSGDVVVAGRIFLREMRTSREGSRHWIWTITDDKGAVRLKFSERRNSQRYPDALWPEGIFVVIRGTLEVDKFTEELVVRVKEGAPEDAPPPAARDSRARIELHVHSKMSAMDGITATKDLFEFAQTVGMSALAIMDHGVVQTYPESEMLSKKTGVRAIYGVEVYMVDTEVKPLMGPRDRDWRSRPFVVVDVETTGLTPITHQVLEIGAVKLQGGQETEIFHRLIRPTRSVSKATERITGIKDEELQSGSDAQEVWREFFRFAEGSVLVAHNARFDLGFLRQGSNHLNPGAPFNPLVLDTLALARAVVPGLKSYGLGPLSDYFKIPLSQHHRALADAEATAHLALRLLALLDKTHPDFQSGDGLEVSHTIGRPTPVTLLIRTQEGVSELYRLISKSHLTYFHRVPRVPRHLIDDGRQYWMIGSPFHGGEVADAVFRGASDEERRELEGFYDYWEVVPPAAARGLASEEFFDGEGPVTDYIKTLVQWGRDSNHWVVAVSDAHYLRPHHHISRDILAETAKGELHDRHDYLFVRTGPEMQEELQFLSQADREWVIYEAPAALVSRLEVLRPIPSGLFSPKLPEAERVVSEEPFRQAALWYGDALPEVVAQRLQKEVRSIVDHGFSSIYYIAHRLVQKSLDDGYLVGSRGSVGSSLVATLLNITEVNPLPPHYRCPGCRYSEFIHNPEIGSGFDLPVRQCPQCQTPLIGDGQDIPFETFLGFEGDKVPDIDLNFSGEYQAEIHRYTEALFGQGHVFRAGTIATVADKTAFGLVKVWARETGRDLTPAMVDWLVSGITGVKRTTGQHPGGLMVVPIDEDIHHFCPVQRPADDKTSDIVTTHFDYHAIEGRLLKLDLLGHDDPTAIRMLEDLTGISAKDVPFQDAETMSLFRDVAALGVKPDDIGTPVGSLGIPEFGTRFVRQMLVDTRPKSFAELVRISGLSHGTEVWTNNAQELIRHKTATLRDVIATRDDIMIYLLQREIAPKLAFGISESVRKGKGLTADQETVMQEHGVPHWYIESCRRISYLFPKAHAAAYVMMGWRIAWFKVHHPLAYYATYFSVRAGDFAADIVLQGLRGVNQALAAIEEKGNEATPKDKGLVTVLEIAREMMARGFRFHPIHLENSHATRFLMESDGLLIPFAALPGLGVSAAQHIIDARQQQTFLSIDDLRQRARLSKSVVELLRTHGALKNLGETSQLGFF